MGAVWLARHRRLPDKRAAIKVLLGTGLKDEAYLRFAREAEIATRIGHPNIVDVLDLASLPSGEPYIVLELLLGEVLRDRLRRVKQLSYDEVCAITRQIGSALLAAHSHDVVHRDLKPENVFLVPTDSGGVIRDHVKVLDFGISKLRGSQTVQTQEAMLLGTPQYMAPEQAAGRNQDVDARTDQFALAIMVYEMLTGTPPWVSDTPLGLLFQVVHAPTPALGQMLPNAPAHAVLAIEQALQKDASKRFADIGQFVAALTGTPLASLDTKKRRTGAHDVAALARSGPVTASTDRETHQEIEEADLATFDGSVAVTAETYAGDALATAQSKARNVVPPVTAVVGDNPQPREFAKPAPVAVAPQPLPAPIAPAVATVPVVPNAATPPWAWLVGAVALAAIAVSVTIVVTRPAAPVPAPAVLVAADKVPTLPAPAVVAPVVAVAAPAPAVIAAPDVVVAAADLIAPSLAATAEQATAQKPDQAEKLAHLARPVAALPKDPPAAAKDSVPAEVVDAETALHAGKLAEAERLAVHSLTAQQTNRAFDVLTRVHCKRGDLGGAQTWFGQLKGAARGAVRKACATDGVTL